MCCFLVYPPYLTQASHCRRLIVDWESIGAVSMVGRSEGCIGGGSGGRQGSHSRYSCFESDTASTYEGSYGNHLLARGKEIITWS
jgi:hypothetical protein